MKSKSGVSALPVVLSILGTIAVICVLWFAIMTFVIVPYEEALLSSGTSDSPSVSEHIESAREQARQYGAAQSRLALNMVSTQPSLLQRLPALSESMGVLNICTLDASGDVLYSSGGEFVPDPMQFVGTSSPVTVFLGEGERTVQLSGVSSANGAVVVEIRPENLILAMSRTSVAVREVNVIDSRSILWAAYGFLAAVISGVSVSIAQIRRFRKRFAEDLSNMTLSVQSVLDTGKVMECASPKEKELYRLHIAVAQLVEAASDIAVESEDIREHSESSSSAKSAFLANMSHEIRTPLYGIIGFSELALDPEVTPAVRDDYLDKIKVSGESLLQIINNILDISKIEAGKMTLEKVPFDLNKVISECQIVVTPRAEQKGLELFVSVDSQITSKIIGDELKLKQVLLNLLSNAIKFTNSGVVKLMCEITGSDKNKVALRFEVKDEGIGMSAAQVSTIFSPFTQADSSTTRKFGGTGLGLSIARQMVELMGGELKVESFEGIGSVFFFVLPFELSELPIGDSESEPTVMKRPVFDGDVLVCEDNEINQTVIVDHLRKVGLWAVVARDGKEGVAEYSRRIKDGSKRFSLILMDINMPVMDGLDATKALRAAGCTLPIVAMTANVLHGGDKLYKSSGFTDYLSKPFKTPDLWAMLYRYLDPVGEKIVTPPAKLAKEKARMSVPVSDEGELDIFGKFCRTEKGTGVFIREAIANGDNKSAHRKAHTLKGLALLIEEQDLANAALAVESALEKGKNELTESQLDTLCEELDKVIARGAPVPSGVGFDKEEAAELFDELYTLLLASDSSCLDLVSSISGYPDTGVLVRYIESCDFIAALETLQVVRDILGV